MSSEFSTITEAVVHYDDKAEAEAVLGPERDPPRDSALLVQEAWPVLRTCASTRRPEPDNLGVFRDMPEVKGLIKAFISTVYHLAKVVFTIIRSAMNLETSGTCPLRALGRAMATFHGTKLLAGVVRAETQSNLLECFFMKAEETGQNIYDILIEYLAEMEQFHEPERRPDKPDQEWALFQRLDLLRRQGLTQVVKYRSKSLTKILRTQSEESVPDMILVDWCKPINSILQIIETRLTLECTGEISDENEAEKWAELFGCFKAHQWREYSSKWASEADIFKYHHIRIADEFNNKENWKSYLIRERAAPMPAFCASRHWNGVEGAPNCAWAVVPFKANVNDYPVSVLAIGVPQGSLLGVVSGEIFCDPEPDMLSSLDKVVAGPNGLYLRMTPCRLWGMKRDTDSNVILAWERYFDHELAGFVSWRVLAFARQPIPAFHVLKWDY